MRGWRRAFHRRIETLHIAGEYATFGDDQLAVADRSRDAAGAMDDQLGARRQFTGELAVDLGDVDRHIALERAGLRNLHRLAVDRRFNFALDHQHVAVRNFDALQLDLRTDPELAAGRVRTYRRRLSLEVLAGRLGCRRHGDAVAEYRRRGIRRDRPSTAGRNLLRDCRRGDRRGRLLRSGEGLFRFLEVAGRQ